MANPPMEHPSSGGSPAIPIRRSDSASSGGSGIGAALGVAISGSVGGGGAIAIPSSYRDTYEDRSRRGRDDLSSDGESDDVARDGFLSGSFSYLGGDVLDDRDGTAVTVGSLPSSRYERRRAAAANNSHMSSMGAGAAAEGAVMAQSLGPGGAGTMSLARSLPPPRAPWLHAKALSDDGLSRVPQMTLPESATVGMVPSSLPYGSLRESKFGHYHQRGRRPPPGGGPQRHVRFAGESPKREGADKVADEGVAAVPGTAGLYPSSLPAYTDAGSEIARRRWEKEAAAAAASPEGGIVIGSGKSAPSPLALGIGGGIGAAAGTGSPGSGVGGGIGAAIGDSPPIDSTSTSNEGGVSSLTAQLGGLPLPSGGGIGEAVMGVAAPTAGSKGTMAEIGDYSTRGGGAYGSSGLYSNQDGTGNDGDYDAEGSNSKLSSSLTALNILESARASPGGLGVALSPHEMQATALDANMAAVAGTGLVQQQLGIATAPYATAPTAHGVSDGYQRADIPPDLGSRPVEEPEHFEAFDLELED
mmetsp:Transcript_48148/g.145435  ORF Transcript_48148/g.145435 Transcript_48148/m.145435 type:complete len:530 (-) Transcript_48148:82-1671(-)|eukprot:CAMPEP_0113535100 /NCGR_PEP_ID=MMETSP0015_2-20120614/5517_1 /TAXON_ID=2838 /ORGANISM="Odontella" /LENGTH=529 /DNA_ID=CAMNT_0000434315 /DNA_START=328 /DNA_END=1917 /DNA_ORIENTATION=+ /assembly_acc=CAM_ASM_000160